MTLDAWDYAINCLASDILNEAPEETEVRHILMAYRSGAATQEETWSLLDTLYEKHCTN